MSTNTSRLFLFAAGLVLLTLAAAGIIVLSALTTWWALFALLALCPLMMLGCGAVMMGAMGGRSGSGFCAGASCAGWLRGDAGRATPTA